MFKFTKQKGLFSRLKISMRTLLYINTIRTALKFWKKLCWVGLLEIFGKTTGSNFVKYLVLATQVRIPCIGTKQFYNAFLSIFKIDKWNDAFYIALISQEHASNIHKFKKIYKYSYFQKFCASGIEPGTFGLQGKSSTTTPHGLLTIGYEKLIFKPP